MFGEFRETGCQHDQPQRIEGFLGTDVHRQLSPFS